MIQDIEYALRFNTPGLEREIKDIEKSLSQYSIAMNILCIILTTIGIGLIGSICLHTPVFMIILFSIMFGVLGSGVFVLEITHIYIQKKLEAFNKELERRNKID